MQKDIRQVSFIPFQDEIAWRSKNLWRLPLESLQSERKPKPLGSARVWERDGENQESEFEIHLIVIYRWSNFDIVKDVCDFVYCKLYIDPY